MQFGKSTLWIGLLGGGACVGWFYAFSTEDISVLSAILCVGTCLLMGVVIAKLAEQAPVCMLNDKYLVLNNSQRLKVILRSDIEIVYWESKDESSRLCIRHNGEVTSLDRSVANLAVLEKELSEHIQ